MEWPMEFFWKAVPTFQIECSQLLHNWIYKYFQTGHITTFNIFQQFKDVGQFANFCLVKDYCDFANSDQVKDDCHLGDFGKLK